MRIALLGTGPFAVPTLRALYKSTHEVVCAVSRPPKGRRAVASPVQQAAEELGVEVWLPETVNCDESRACISDMNLDLTVVCDYGEILKPATLGLARLGEINLHGSLLPKYRGAAPVQWAVLNGEVETGNTVFQLTPGVDAGPCLGMQKLAIDPDETAGELEVRLAECGAELVMNIVEQLAAGTAQPLEQDKSKATKAPRLSKELGLIDWTKTAQQIHNQVRALQPWPRAYTNWQRSQQEPLRLIVHRSRLVGDRSDIAPGSVLKVDGTLVVSTGDGLIALEEIQPAGKRAMQAEEFLRGYQIQVGDQLE